MDGQTCSLEAEWGRRVQVGKDVENQLGGEGGDDVELERSCAGQAMQLAPLVRRQFAKQGGEGLYAGSGGPQGPEGGEEGWRRHGLEGFRVINGGSRGM